uniref:Uncharacterized protein n=1 Tax=Vitis vinifera TaxID=29760 RepID=F6HGG4_VITVI
MKISKETGIKGIRPTFKKAGSGE